MYPCYISIVCKLKKGAGSDSNMRWISYQKVALVSLHAEVNALRVYFESRQTCSFIPAWFVTWINLRLFHMAACFAAMCDIQPHALRSFTIVRVLWEPLTWYFNLLRNCWRHVAHSKINDHTIWIFNTWLHQYFITNCFKSVLILLFLNSKYLWHLLKTTLAWILVKLIAFFTKLLNRFQIPSLDDTFSAIKIIPSTTRETPKVKK